MVGYEQCYSCEWYDEVYDEETNEEYPLCSKPADMKYPTGCPDRAEGSEPRW